MSEEAKKPKTQVDDDRAIIEAFQSEHNKDAFDKLVVKYQNMVFNLCYRFMGNCEDASDCAQDTFVKVYRALEYFRFDSEFSTWLYRIAVNTCKNKLSSLAYRFSKIMVRIDKLRGVTGDDPPVEIKDESRSPEAEFEKTEKSKLIQKAIDSLPEEQKIVVVLRDIEGLSYDDISEITGYNLGTVKSKLYRAREVLRNKLKGSV